MELLLTVSIESIELIIDKKRQKIRGLENSEFHEPNFKEKINELHREINLLYVAEYKLKELYKFIQDLDS